MQHKGLSEVQGEVQGEAQGAGGHSNGDSAAGGLTGGGLGSSTAFGSAQWKAMHMVRTARARELIGAAPRQIRGGRRRRAAAAAGTHAGLLTLARSLVL